VLLTETRTDDMNRLMIDLSASHKFIGHTSIPHGCASRRGSGVAVVAANSCADFLILHKVSQSLNVCGSVVKVVSLDLLKMVLFTFRSKAKLCRVHK